MPIRHCTWEACTNFADHLQFDDVENIWADLCDFHHQKLKEALKAPATLPEMTSAMVKANGGKNKSSEKVM